MVAEKTRQQWLRAVRRWSLVGAVGGLGFGVYAHLAWGGSPGLLGSVAFYVPMGTAMVLILWASMYRFDFAQVWGWRPMGLTFVAVAVLLATGVGVGCAQGVCGDR